MSNRGGRGGGRGSFQGARGDRGGGRGAFQGAREDRGGGRGAFQGARGRGYQGSDRARGFQGPRDGGGGTFSLPEGENQPIIKRSSLNPGNAGQEIELLSNFYKLTTSDKMIIHYDIDIKEKDQKENANNQKFLKKIAVKLIPAWTEQNKNVFGNIRYIYDGWKNLFTPELLKVQGVNEELTFDLEGRKIVFIIKIKQVNKVDSSIILSYFQNQTNHIPEMVITVMEVLLKNICEKNFSYYQRKFFDTDRPKDGRNPRYYQFVSGFASAIRVAQFGLAMNLHLKTTCTISKTLLSLQELVENYSREKAENLIRNRFALRNVNRLVRHLKIFTNHSGHKQTYLIEKLVEETPYQMKLEKKNDDGGVVQITIAEYFKKTYDIDCRKYPSVKTTGKYAKYLPLELCKLVDKQFLASNKMDDAEISKDLLFQSTKKPEQYFTEIQNYANKIINTDQKLLNDFGLSINAKPIKFKGRILPEPKQFCANKGNKFHAPPQSTLNWAMFNLDPQIKEEALKSSENKKENKKTALESFSEKLIKECNFFGMKFNPNASVLTSVNVQKLEDVKNILRNLSDHKTRTKLELNIVFFVIPERHPVLKSSDIYNTIKAFGDRSQEKIGQGIGGYGLVTQCIKGSYVFKTPGGYFENIALKINGKVGGVNNIVDPNEITTKTSLNPNTTMVIGIDVNHPSIEENTQSSVAAAVGSFDDKFSRYTASIRVQRKEEYEIIEQLDSMIEELIKEYMKHNKNQGPETLVVFRDGVSEGQFDFIKDKELPKIRKAVDNFKKKAKIVLFVVQKRHHTRFVSVQGGHGFKRDSHNVPKGTVVDNSITDPKYDQFYINSHFSPLGTSKPTKYVLLKNDCKLQPNQLHALCLYMCYNCVRVRGVIAIPTPIRYADLCAYRSKLHIEGQFKLPHNLVDNTKQELFERYINQLNDWVKISKDVQNFLYYC